MSFYFSFTSLQSDEHSQKQTKSGIKGKSIPRNRNGPVTANLHPWVTASQYSSSTSGNSQANGQVFPNSTTSEYIINQNSNQTLLPHQNMHGQAMGQTTTSQQHQQVQYPMSQLAEPLMQQSYGNQIGNTDEWNCCMPTSGYESSLYSVGMSDDPVSRTAGSGKSHQNNQEHENGTSLGGKTRHDRNDTSSSNYAPLLQVTIMA